MNLLHCDDVPSFVADNQDDGSQLWVLHHVPRTAGTSLVAEIGRSLRPFYNVHVPAASFASGEVDPDAEIEVAFRDFWQAQAATPFRFACGHLLPSHIRHLRALPRARVFTILRDPVQQILSTYRYAASPAFPHFRTFLRECPDFDSFIENPRWQNPIATSIGGRGTSPRECLDILARDYLFCGLFEELELSFGMVRLLLRLEPDARTAHLNASPTNPLHEVAAAASYRDKILAANPVDAEIYRSVRQRFEERREGMVRCLKIADLARSAARRAALHVELRRLVGEIADRDQRLERADKELRRLVDEAAERDQRLGAADTDLRRLVGEVADRDQMLGAADKELQRLVREVADRDQRLGAADADLRRLVGEVADRNQRLAAADKDLTRLTIAVADRERQLIAAESARRRLMHEAQEQNDRLSDALTRARRRVEDQALELSAVKGSLSWRITSPFRRVAGSFAWLFDPLRQRQRAAWRQASRREEYSDDNVGTLRS